VREELPVTLFGCWPRVATVTTDWSDIENKQHRPPNVGYTSVPPETAADRGASL
jgi:hypothetical protein